ncbi:transcriptional regulator, LytTR family [Tangfeifania diversioriginum]|uniref:Transcriptional regulator, LytTR family n=1 Tax=Tangfeifania diversioriginum TaxID=1168035 RepID=A0A1M6HAB2_9BACT|nr:LytTR family DNA-binding domain-containing protein [Tangfeifania diversioriginum]SHJ19161.1 transcriptional regulator, LytTR family [Tangfeifania diversioriginum]
MFNSLNKFYPFNDDLKLNLQSISGVSLGLFLFLLFLQPLDPPVTDFNKKLLIITGYGVITLILLSLLRIFAPSLFPKLFLPEKWTQKNEIVLHIIFVILNSVAFAFYTTYVANIEITFSLTVKIVLISLFPTLFLVIIYEYHTLRLRLQHLLNQDNDFSQPKAEKGSDDLIEFESENQGEYFTLFPEQIIVIRAASNYVEIIYKDKNKVARRLIRSTMKKTEKELSNVPFLLRCHRSCIVNSNYIQQVLKTPEGLKLKLYDYPREIKVSRQYVLSVKNAMENPV